MKKNEFWDQEVASSNLAIPIFRFRSISGLPASQDCPPAFNHLVISEKHGGTGPIGSGAAAQPIGRFFDVVPSGNNLSAPAMDFSQIFGNTHPVEVDLGCGKGGFTLALSQKFPSGNFFGVDYVDRWLRKGVLPEEKKIQPNLAFVRTESLNFVTMCPDESVIAFYVQFPDPWPKRRHRRRRVFEPKFLGELHRALRPKGFLHVATDDPDYFSAMKAVVEVSTIKWRSVRVSINQRIAHPELKTLYEAKFSAMGKTIHYMELIK